MIILKLVLVILGMTQINAGETSVQNSVELLCPFTYEQGLNVGCKIALDANANGCYSTSCSNAYQKTLSKFGECTDYILGVMQGWQNCNGSTPNDDETGTGTGTGGGSDNPCPQPPMSPDCECTSTGWACP